MNQLQDELPPGDKLNLAIHWGPENRMEKSKENRMQRIGYPTSEKDNKLQENRYKFGILMGQDNGYDGMFQGI